MRTAIVTGGTAGIGLAVARALLQRGDAAFVCARDSRRLADALSSLASHGRDRLAGMVCDVRDASSVEAMVDAAGDRFERVDALINAAGVGTIAPIDGLTPEAWQNMIDTNLTGVFNCCRATLPLLTAAGQADIVNLGSRAGRYAFQGGVGYNTTKFGLQGFTEALFLDLHPRGIRVSLVAPGTVATGLAGVAPQDWHLDADDVAQAVLHVLDADFRAAINWVEIRPARPPVT